MKAGYFCLPALLLAMPVGAAVWGTLFYSEAERHPPMASPPASTTPHVYSAQTIADGHVRNWVDGASAPVRVPRGKKVGESWLEAQ
jgi:hypothetical protein